MQRFRKSCGLDFPQHKSAQLQENNDAGDTLQVIGAGLPRTGTSSLKAALEILGFDPCHHMAECFNYPTHSHAFSALINAKTNPTATTPHTYSHRLAAVQRCLRGYRAAVDAPTCEIYSDLLTLNPSLKIILSVRDSETAWWKSFSETVAQQFALSYGILVYPIPFLRAQHGVAAAIKRHWTSTLLMGGQEIGPGVYTAHNRRVRETVPAGQLLEFNVKEGWPRLCAFLEVPVPEVPFPNLNDAKALKKVMKRTRMMGAAVWMIYLTLVGLSAFLLIAPPSGLERAVGL
ncbi:hypothetical protein XANCAGTX0491_006083 [Xanthoria calcicola]